MRRPAAAPAARPPREVVLVGGGHSHVQVLRMQQMEPLPCARLTVVVDRPVAVYSGMVPGFVAGQYPRHALEIDVRPLARRAGARVVVAALEGIDPGTRTLHLHGRPPLRYDLASLNIGSTVAGADLPGVRAHALPTRPIGRFVAAVDAAVASARARRGGASLRVVVVGAGAGGVELAFCLHARIGREAGRPPQVTLLGAGPHPLPGQPARVVAAVRAAAAARGITLRDGVQVEACEEGAVALSGGERLDADLTVWVTGAVAHRALAASGLPTDSRGFVRITDDLQVVAQPGLFAVGDCAVLDSWPDCPRAGVYAVRQGPVLRDNLQRALSGRPLIDYKPQRDFLALLNLGDGAAVAARNGLTWTGRAAFTLKDRIDRRFMERFQVLDAAGAPLAPFDAGLPPMPEMATACGGCAAKVGASALSRALGRLPPQADPDVVMGLSPPDDAVALQRPGEALVASIDAFPAFMDDPWLVGRVAALNALSDIEAKGAAGRMALALVTVPEDDDAEETLYQVLAGVRQELDRAGVTLGGGHSTIGPRLQVGLAVFGFVPDAGALAGKGGAAPGDALILTGPLGTGALFHADMAGRARGRDVAAAVAAMLVPSSRPAGIARDHGARAMTDITGFGLAGHLGEVLAASGAGARIDLDAVPALPGVLGLLSRGERSTFHAQNAETLRSFRLSDATPDDPRVALLVDPQTAGPLLVAVPAVRAARLVAALRAGGLPDAAVIGAVTRWDPGAPRVVLQTSR